MKLDTIRLPRTVPRSLLVRLVVAVALVCLGAIVRLVALQGLGTRASYIIFYPAIVLAAFYGGFWPALLATLLSATLADYFWMAPTGYFLPQDGWNAVLLAIFCLSGFLISVLAEILARRTHALTLAGEQLRAGFVQRVILEERFRNIVEIAPQPFFVVDKRDVIELVNASAERIFGYDRGEMIGKSIACLAPERYRQARTAMRSQFLEAPDAHNITIPRESLGLRKDGTEFPIEIEMARLPDADDFILFAIVTDISERKKVENALLQSQERFRNIIENAPNGIVIVNRCGSIELVNASAEQSFGYSRDEMVGMAIECLVPEPFRAAHPARREAYCEAPGIRPMGVGLALYGQRKDGTVFPAEIAISPMPDGDNYGFVATVTDISARHLIQRELARSHERVSIAVDAARLGFWDFDPASQTMQWDDRMYQLYGHTPRPGRQPLEFWSNALHPATRTEVLGWLADVLSTGDEFESEIRILTPSGEERMLQASGRVVRNPDGTARELVGVNADITDLKRAEMRIAEERDKAQAASRAKSRFLATMSHELRTPMNGVIGLNELLRETEMDPHQRQLADGVGQSAELLLSIINDILDFAKLEAGRFQLDSTGINLPRLLDDTVALLAPIAAEKGLQLSCETTGACSGTFIGDPIRLRQIILNLLSNAIKFTPHGSVRVEAHCEALGGTLAPDRSRLRLTVSDTGIGIDAAGKSRLFRPFEQIDDQLSRRFGGSGLGLNICKELVTLMGGRIGVEDRHGGGSSFWFEIDLPLTADDAAIQSPALQGPSPVARESGRILIADDNALNLQLARMTLEPIGYVIDVATDGRQAVELAASHAYDLILMDMLMPELDGLAATRLIRGTESGRQVPIIAMTANVATADREICRAAGMSDFLGKPCAPARMRELVKDWLHRGLHRPSPADGPVSRAIPATAAAPEIDTRVIDRLRSSLSEECFVGMLDLGLRQIPQSIARLQRTDLRSNEVAEIAQSLIGPAVVFGAHRVEMLARRLKAAAQGDRPGIIEQATSDMVAAWDAALMELTLVRTFMPCD